MAQPEPATIHAAVKKAITQAAKENQPVKFTFSGCEVIAHPNSLPIDLVHVWFWKNQFEKWEAALR